MNEKQASVAARIAELACLPMSELWTVWDRYFPRRPDYPNRTHVESRLAYKLQEEAFGGLADADLGELANALAGGLGGLVGMLDHGVERGIVGGHGVYSCN